MPKSEFEILADGLKEAVEFNQPTRALTYLADMMPMIWERIGGDESLPETVKKPTEKAQVATSETSTSKAKTKSKAKSKAASSSSKSDES